MLNIWHAQLQKSCEWIILGWVDIRFHGIH